MIFDEQVHDERDEAVAQLAQMLKDGARAHAAWTLFDVTWRERIESGLSGLAAQLVDAAQATYGARTHTATEQQSPESDWIEWTGGACPVLRGVKVEVRYRNGEVDGGNAGAWLWTHHDEGHDIVAYRLSEPKS